MMQLAKRKPINLDAREISQRIGLLLACYPEMAEDEVLRADMIEAETGLHEFLRFAERTRAEAEGLADAIDVTIKQWIERRGRFRRRDEAVRALILDLLQAADLRKVELPEATLSIRKGTPHVIITDEAELPEEFWRVRREPNKEKIKDAIVEQHKTVPGASMSNAADGLTIRR